MLEKFTDHLSTQIAILITAAVFIFVLFIIVSKCFFDLDYNEMGQIGSAVGGLIGPALTAISLYYLYQNLKLYRESIERLDINQQITSHENYFKDGIKHDMLMLDSMQSDINTIIAENADSIRNLKSSIPFLTIQNLIIITSKINKALSDGRLFNEKQPSFLINISYKIYELGIDNKLRKLKHTIESGNTDDEHLLVIDPNVLPYFTQMLSSIEKNIYPAPS